MHAEYQPIIPNRPELVVSQNTEMGIREPGLLTSVIDYILNSLQLVLVLFLTRIIVKYDFFFHEFSIDYLSKMDISVFSFCLEILHIIGQIMSGIVHFGCLFYFFYLSYISISAAYPTPKKNKENIIIFIATYILCFFFEYFIFQSIKYLLENMNQTRYISNLAGILAFCAGAVLYLIFLNTELSVARKSSKQREVWSNVFWFHKLYLLYLRISIIYLILYGIVVVMFFTGIY